ncbi:MAG: hypothetical protein JRI23_22940 [Deltaproteobacteria bacterium]|jgi:hypothetical protein|nr:hypothetical protein [Deltaproteobacteria bacterium]MBW2534826.1 hypothetical protein [Deltaproteobacteria bacterium]
MTTVDPQWQAWCDQAQALMDQRNDAWQSEYGLLDAPYRWRVQPPELVFDRGADEVVAELCFVGSYCPEVGDFRWAWGNTSIDRDVRERLDEVRRLGATRGWSLLTEPRVPGGEELPDLVAAVAGRAQDAVGTFVEESGDLTLVFTILRIRVRPNGS